MQGIPIYLLAALAGMCLFGCSGRPATAGRRSATAAAWATASVWAPGRRRRVGSMKRRPSGKTNQPIILFPRIERGQQKGV